MSEYPSDWTICNLGDHLEETKERAGGKVITPYSVSKVLGIVPQSEKFNKRVASSNISNYKVIRKGDFAYDPMLLWDGSINRMLREGTGAVSPAYVTFRVSSNALDADYLLHLLKASTTKNFYKSISKGTNVRRQKAEFGDFAAGEFAFPPLPEQKKIAEILSGIDSQLTICVKKSEKLNDLLQAIVDSEVHARFGKYNDRPLASYFSEKPSNGISPPETEEDDFIAAPGIDCISKNGFEAKRLKKVKRPLDWQRYLIREGDFFITRANTPQLVGMCAVAKSIFQEMIYPDLMVRLKFKNPIHGIYLESIFGSSRYRQIIQNSAQGTSQSMAKLNGQIISNIKVAIPADSEVQRFNEHIDGIMKSIESQKNRIERLTKFKNGLASDLLSGRRRVSI